MANQKNSNISIEEAQRAMKLWLQKIPTYAYGWHAALAGKMIDGGVPFYVAHHLAGQFMLQTFDVDTSNSELIPDTEGGSGSMTLVTSVNEQTGEVILNTDDLDDADASTNFFVTSTQRTWLDNSVDQMGNVAIPTSSLDLKQNEQFVSNNQKLWLENVQVDSEDNSVGIPTSAIDFGDDEKLLTQNQLLAVESIHNGNGGVNLGDGQLSGDQASAVEKIHDGSGGVSIDPSNISFGSDQKFVTANEKSAIDIIHDDNGGVDLSSVNISVDTSDINFTVDEKLLTADEKSAIGIIHDGSGGVSVDPDDINFGSDQNFVTANEKSAVDVIHDDSGGVSIEPDDINFGSDQNFTTTNEKDLLSKILNGILPLGNGYLWVGSDGKVRVDTSEPSSSTETQEGTVIGEQTGA